MKILIKYIEQRDYIEILATDFKFKRLRGIKGMIDNVLAGEVITESLIHVPLESKNLNDIYDNLKILFEEEFGCEVEFESTAQGVFEDAELEAKKFEEFSQKAKKIRNNEVELLEITDFCEKLSSTEFKRELKIYQLLAAYHIAFSQNSCNFSVPGSGKTSTVLAAYEYLRKQANDLKKVEKIVILGPLSAFYAWKSEYEECFGKRPNVLEVRGGMDRNIARQEIYTSTIEYEMIIISYGSVKNYYKEIEHLTKKHKCMLVLDEAHRIKKTGDEAQSKFVLDLAPYAKSRIILTGTPAANSYVDLYNLFKFIWPHNNVIGYSIPQLAMMSKNDKDVRIGNLVEKISPFYIRVKKGDLELPSPVFHEPIIVNMSKKQREIYEAIENFIVNKYESNGLPDGLKRATLIRLRQAASNPALLSSAIEEEYYDYDDEIEVDSRDNSRTEELNVELSIEALVKTYCSREVPNKYIEALKLVKEKINAEEQVIIWCEFTGTCEGLSEYFFQEGIENRILYGKCSLEEREEIIAEFLNENNSRFKVIVANPHAVGESISLHKSCHNAIYLEQGFNAGTYMQSKDRIHRVGIDEKQDTNYYFLHSSESIDEVVYQRVLKKEEKMLHIIENEEIPLLEKNLDLSKISDDDVKAVIRSYYERRNKII